MCCRDVVCCPDFLVVGETERNGEDEVGAGGEAAEGDVEGVDV